MGKIATNVLAGGSGWSVADVVCTFGPLDRSFEEQHTTISITVVLEGSFQYRSPFGSDLLSPGSLLLGSLEEPFECEYTSTAPVIVVWPFFTRRNSLNAPAWPLLFLRIVSPRFQICRH